MIPPPSPLGQVAHDLVEEAGYCELSWFGEQGDTSGPPEEQRHFRARAVQHETIALLDHRPAEAAAWRCVQSVLDACEWLTSEVPCAHCGYTQAEGRLLNVDYLQHAKAFWDQNYPGTWDAETEAHYAFQPREGWQLPDGSWYCRYCGMRGVYDALTAGLLLPTPLESKGDPST